MNATIRRRRSGRRAAGKPANPKAFLIFLAVLLVLGGGYWLVTFLIAYRPLVASIPLVEPGTAVTISGSRFGTQPVAVSLVKADGSTEALQVSSWTPGQIVVSLPAGTASGAITVTAHTFLGDRTSLPRGFVVHAAGLPSEPNGYDVPVQADSPWPTFRRDEHNTADSPLPAVYGNDKPWFFQTEKGIFSTPVIDGNGAIYFGSADHFFYALNPDGTLKWKYETGEIIDSAGALTAPDPATGAPTITFISGDGKMYHFRTDDVPADGRSLWTYEAQLRPGISYNRWFEGNVAVGYDGTLYSGNTNFLYYAINPDGTLKWTYATGSNNWSQAAFGSDGTIFWGSNDTYLRGVDPGGRQLWKKMTLGFVAASAAVGSDGTVYMGSFDSNLYALDPQTGAVRWKFPTNDHIYASVALASVAGRTSAIYLASADGTLYALNTDGTLKWKYDTGDVIRSSPVIGKTADGSGDIVYFGAGNGRLYALNADGTLRWSFDTTSTEAELADRNDLNGSPALGKTGIYIGGEHGQLWYVPYDYCLNATDDTRCSTAQSLPQDFTGLYYVTPGGNTEAAFPDSLPASTMLTLRLVVRQNGATVNARLCNNPVGCPKDSLVVSFDPTVPFDVQHSADGKYIYIRPQEFLAPDRTYTISVSGNYYTGGWRLGNLTLGGSRAGSFDGQFSFKAQDSGARLPLTIGSDSVSALEWTRLAAPIPSMLPSLNQIGFDYMDWLMAPVVVTPPDANGQGNFVLWAIGAKRQTDGTLVPDPASDFAIPLSGRYQGGDFVLTDRNFPMAITGIQIPFNLFELRGQLRADGVTLHPAAYADTQALSIPTFGPYLVVAGLANNWYQKLLVAGTYITRPYDGAANHAPLAVLAKDVTFTPPTDKQAGQVVATLSVLPGNSYPTDGHRAAILLVDPATSGAVFMDYHANLSVQADADGNLASVTLALPKGMSLPAQLRAYVILDVFPAFSKDLLP
ncbi:MAG TPA: PQQ-binding-like beta-propeller repeat protein [Anaerolineales bacterium]|nr:PQQ-binding-like beta-propeller repeat protein [Anaerolineales bacterium]